MSFIVSTFVHTRQTQSREIQCTNISGIIINHFKDLLDCDDDEARRTPWMKLTDLDVSYNAIEELDNSLVNKYV